MISAALKGGLGNQMFQIAAAYALALRNSDIAIFDFSKCHTPLQGKPSTHYADTILRKVIQVPDYQFKFLYKEPAHSFREIPYQSDLILDGYFQSEKYFKDQKDAILKLFTFEDDGTDEIIRHVIEVEPDEEFVSVHIRRGDYLNNPNIHPTCDLEYYTRAINKAKEWFPNGVKFVFISDDISWVKNNFKDDDFIYSRLKDDVMEMKLMTLASGNIIANSSFSWWGTYLNQRKKFVISPSRWFGPNGPQDQDDIIPEDWIKI